VTVWVTFYEFINSSVSQKIPLNPPLKKGGLPDSFRLPPHQPPLFQRTAAPVPLFSKEGLGEILLKLILDVLAKGLFCSFSVMPEVVCRASTWILACAGVTGIMTFSETVKAHFFDIDLKMYCKYC
jgi:hypothetical protein